MRAPLVLALVVATAAAGGVAARAAGPSPAPRVELMVAGRAHLEDAPATAVAAPRTTLRVTVRGYDDRGRGIAVAGAVVRLAGLTRQTDGTGAATLQVPARTGVYSIDATGARTVPAFPARVTVR